MIKNSNRLILVPVPRDNQRSALPLVSDYYNKNLIYGYDLWVCYELSWLNLNGKPEIRVMEMSVPSNSRNIVESKSLKLYLNSFNNIKISSEAEVKNIIETNLSNLTGAMVDVKFFKSEQYKDAEYIGKNIDDLDVEIDKFTTDANLIKFDKSKIILEEHLYSHLFRSNCPMTNQPDFATLHIVYNGKKIDHKSLLQYLVSFRDHKAFHEQCIEHIFCDLFKTGNFQTLSLYGLFARRGGISIIPFRSNFNNFYKIR